MIYRVISLIFMCITSGQVYSQYQIGLIPRVSPDKSVYQKIGYTEVEITYGSPSVNNRQVWGNMAPYDKVWRAGANNATTVSFSAPVQIQNNTVDSGSYALFIIPREQELWTVILSNKADQWGSFRYDSSDDALRIDVYPDHSPKQVEKLNYSIEQLGYQNGKIIMSWDHLMVQIPFETDYIKAFINQVEHRVASQDDYIKWVVYIQGAEHLLDMNKTDTWNDQFYPRDYVAGHLYWTKAKLSAKNEDYDQALIYADKLTKLSNAMYYERKKDSQQIEALIETWREK